MKSSGHRSPGLVWVLVLAGCASHGFEEATTDTRSQALTGEEMLAPFPNSAGSAQTATPSGVIDTGNEFFQDLRLFDRNCGDCHQADAGWTITPPNLQARFEATGGTDPVFRAFDLGDYPNAPVGTLEERQASYSRTLRKALVRVQLPSSAPFRRFRLVSVTPPAGEPADAGYPAGTVSFFRRPLPTSNLRFASTVNWDGRSSPGAVNVPAPIPIFTGLLNQSNGATLNHAWLPNPAGAFVPITQAVREAIVNQELAFHIAQTVHAEAGDLGANGATGGPAALLTETGGSAGGGPVFTLFDAWTNDPDPMRQSVARGQAIFNTKTLALNASGNPIRCSGCHNSKNVGTSVNAVFFDVGVSDPARAGDVTNWQADVPLFVFEELSGPVGDPASAPTGNTIQTTDPGRALFSGSWNDMNKFKAPALRGLAARAPYFHDGSAKDIKHVVNHYSDHFGILWAKGEKQDLIRFLEAL